MQNMFVVNQAFCYPTNINYLWMSQPMAVQNLLLYLLTAQPWQKLLKTPISVRDWNLGDTPHRVSPHA